MNIHRHQPTFVVAGLSHIAQQTSFGHPHPPATDELFHIIAPAKSERPTLRLPVYGLQSRTFIPFRSRYSTDVTNNNYSILELNIVRRNTNKMSCLEIVFFFFIHCQQDVSNVCK